MNFRTNLSIFLVGCFLIFEAQLTLGSTLKGSLAFSKRAPNVALIYFSEDQSLKQDAVIDQKNTSFTVPLAVGSKGSNAVFNNSDSINHNIFANDKEVKVNFDIGLAAPGSVFQNEITWDSGQMVKISCKIHPKMRAYVGSLSSKYYQVVPFKKKQKKALIDISDVPDNLTKVTIWMPGYETLNIDLPKGGSETIELKRKKKKRGTLTLTRS